MEPIIDFLAEAELKAAEQLVAEIFDVKQARQCRSVIDRKNLKKARMAGKDERVAKLVNNLATIASQNLAN
jgi:uncharacterized protein YdcH (DUF465 family)